MQEWSFHALRQFIDGAYVGLGQLRALHLGLLIPQALLGLQPLGPALAPCPGEGCGQLSSSAFQAQFSRAGELSQPLTSYSGLHLTWVTQENWPCFIRFLLIFFTEILTFKTLTVKFNSPFSGIKCGLGKFFSGFCFKNSHLSQGFISVKTITKCL